MVSSRKVVEMDIQTMQNLQQRPDFVSCLMWTVISVLLPLLLLENM